MARHKFPLFSVPIVQRVRCDLCGRECLCVYIREMDRWMCSRCVEKIAGLLEIFD